MDSAYDAPQIHEYSRRLDHVPLIDTNPRRNKALKEELANENKRCKVANYQTAEAQRYHERSTVEQVNRRLKDEFVALCMGTRSCQGDVPLDVRILALTADQLLSFVT